MSKKKKEYVIDIAEQQKSKLSLAELKKWRPSREMMESGQYCMITGFKKEWDRNRDRSSPAENVRL